MLTIFPIVWCRKLWWIGQTKGSIALRASQSITRIKRPWIRFIMDFPFGKMTIFIIQHGFSIKSFWVMSFSINCHRIVFNGGQWGSRLYWLFFRYSADIQDPGLLIHSLETDLCCCTRHHTSSSPIDILYFTLALQISCLEHEYQMQQKQSLKYILLLLNLKAKLRDIFWSGFNLGLYFHVCVLKW